MNKFVVIQYPMKASSGFISLLFCLLLCLGMVRGFGQAPYRVAPVQTGFTMGIGGLVLGGALLYKASIDPLSSAQIMEIKTRGVNGFDGLFAGGNYHKGYHQASEVLKITNLVPLVFYALPAYRSQYGTLNIMAVESFVLTAAVTQVNKVLVKRPRPYVNQDQPIYNPTESDARLSFFSGHTSSVASTSFLLAKTIIDVQGIESRAKKGWIYTGAAVVPATMAALRMAAGKHFMTDVLTGYLVGVGVGLLVPRLHTER